MRIISDFKIIIIIMLFVLTMFVAPGVAGDRGNPSAGKVIYEKNCAICHGKEGKGDGPGAKALEPKPKDLPSPSFRSKSDREILR